MRIALCFSGQLRTWRKTITQFKKFISILEDKGHSVDVFCHMWNFNTYPNSIAHKLMDYSSQEIVEQDEIDQLISELTPKSFLIETQLESKKVQEQILNPRSNIIKERCGINQLGNFFAPQFYSIMRSAHLKRKYESDYNIVYDCCFRLRYDLWLLDNHIEYFFENAKEFQNPKGNTIYSVHNGRLNNHPYFRVGDIFWFSDSNTFDRICDFVRWLRLYGPNALSNDNLLIESTFFYYLKFINLNLHMLYTDPVIARSDDYTELRQQAGYDGVMSCDKI